MSNPDQSPASLDLDEYARACAFAREKASVAYVQRKMGTIGFMRAIEYMERMISDGVISTYAGRNLERMVATEAAAMAATVPAGWVLVPEMPTKEMLAAAGAACEGRMYPASMTHGPRAQNTDRYIAMLDAAPQAPVADQAADEARMLRDLLARIHGDGGQYLDQHGLEKAVQDADEMVAKWQAGQPAEPSPAQLVMAALESGEWEVQRHLPHSSFTEAANKEHAWSVKRHAAPYGSEDGNHVWTGPTAIAALQKACAALNLALPQAPAVAPKGDSNG